jgi:SAM-dependent methyltransferase
MPADNPFAALAAEYARFRPRYPGALFEYLAGVAPARGRVWDCGTGSGQAASALARWFDAVIATDASAEQIARARPTPGVAYCVAMAERCPLPAACCDLVTVAQALHWFDHAVFFAEARRVLKPAGVIAVWTYRRISATPAVDSVLARLYGEVVGRWWPENRSLVESGYRELVFPFVEMQGPSLAVEARWTLGDLIGYLGTWSASARYRQAHGRDPIDEVRSELTQAWGDAEAQHTVRWPISMRIGTRDAE